MIIKNLLFGLFCLIIGIVPAFSQTRSWTSKDGTETVEGKFHSRNGTQITLILKNGTSRVIDSRLLSDNDLAWVDAQNSSGDEPIGGDLNAEIPVVLKGKLRDRRGASVALDTRKGGVPKYYLFYYSASWCGPCQKFTPSLLRFYKRYSDKLGMEVVLVPGDRSERDSLAYMREHRMPWVGVDFKARGARGIPGNPGRTIPAMRLTDENGKTLLSTAKVNRNKFFAEAKKIMSGGS